MWGHSTAASENDLLGCLMLTYLHVGDERAIPECWWLGEEAEVREISLLLLLFSWVEFGDTNGLEAPI